MAEKNKSIGSSSLRSPSKEQIIARLVQIRDYIIKAEETLSEMGPYLQNDPKVFQLHDMISELRDTEKRLLEMLREFEANGRESSSFENNVDMDSHISPPQSFPSNLNSSTVDEAIQDFSMYGAHSSNGVDPELLAERDKLFAQRDILDRRCQQSQQHIEALESERSYLLDLSQKLSGRDKSSSICSPPTVNSGEAEMDNKQLLREISSTIASRRCQSADGQQPISEELQEAEICCRNLSELQGKRFEIHKIMSEIALLRRAKDESSRKIDLLQQALSGNSSNSEIKRPEYAAPWSTEPKEDLSKIIQHLSLRDQNDSNTVATSDWNENFYRTFSGKLLEIQTMREKLEALQTLVHSIPTQSPNYQSLDNDLEFAEQSSSGCEAPKNVGLNTREVAIDEVLSPDARNSEFVQSFQNCSSSLQNQEFEKYSADGMMKRSRNHVNKKSRSRASDSKDEGYRQQLKTCQNNQQHELSGHSYLYKPYEANYFQPIVSSSGRTSNGNIERLLARARNQNEGHDVVSQTDEKSNRGPNAADYMDSIWNWVPNTGGPQDNSNSNGSHRKYQNSANNNGSVFVDRYMTETTTVLKHLVDSVTQISSGLSAQKNQLEILNFHMSKLAERVELLIAGGGNDTRLFSADHAERNISTPIRARSNRERPLNNEALDNSLYDLGFPFYGYPFKHEKVRDLSKGVYGTACSPGLRELWNGGPPNLAAAASSYPSEHPRISPSYPHENLEHPSSSIPIRNQNSQVPSLNGSRRMDSPSLWTSSNNQDQGSQFLMKRHWASPPPLHTLNNQVPPGTRNNNYWDNFRSQSRQNVLSSSSKSNESSNSVVAINTEVNNQATGLPNNFNRRDVRSDKNPGGKPTKPIWMNHFVENIGSKKRNQEQQRQLLPQRSVSVGSMHHYGEVSTPGPSHASRRRNGREDGHDLSTGCLGINNKPIRRQEEYNDLYPSNKLRYHPEEINSYTYTTGNENCFTEMCQKLSQMKNDVIRMRTIDAVRKVVEQSIRQDELSNGETLSSVHLQSHAEMNLPRVNSGARLLQDCTTSPIRAANCAGEAASFNFNDLLGQVTSPRSPTSISSSPQTSNVSREIRRPEDQYVPSIIASFHAAQKSIAEAHSNSPVLESPTSRRDVGLVVRARYQESTECQFPENTVSSCKGDSYFDYECDLLEENGNDKVVTTLRDLTVVESNLDSNNRNDVSSCSIPLVESPCASRSDLTSAESLTGFNKYKGQLSTTNNPWMSHGSYDDVVSSFTNTGQRETEFVDSTELSQINSVEQSASNETEVHSSSEARGGEVDMTTKP